jgi:hypothetical protein
MGLPALLGRLDRDPSQPVGAQPLAVGMVREHRKQPGRAELGRLLHDEIRPRLLHRREHQPQVRRQPLLRRPFPHGQPPLPPGPRDLRAPLPVAPVEERDRIAHREAHHVEEIMRLLAIEPDLGARPERRLDKKPDLRRAFCHRLRSHEPRH